MKDFYLENVILGRMKESNEGIGTDASTTLEIKGIGTDASTTLENERLLPRECDSRQNEGIGTDAGTTLEIKGIGTDASTTLETKGIGELGELDMNAVTKEMKDMKRELENLMSQIGGDEFRNNFPHKIVTNKRSHSEIIGEDFNVG
ncbi:unnamed protein product [Ambrosiozyma monospora]|uniref:Unnamed protein product n=1 Tax=Ambrosiozyma monospora TaxID=43982 RepID=A0A9W6Z8K5_AMBMO|nr:unnamed protein product [Ambrosiozyma monospora]